MKRVIAIFLLYSSQKKPVSRRKQRCVGFLHRRAEAVYLQTVRLYLDQEILIRLFFGLAIMLIVHCDLKLMKRLSKLRSFS